jgi:hypothetical protein
MFLIMSACRPSSPLTCNPNAETLNKHDRWNLHFLRPHCHDFHIKTDDKKALRASSCWRLRHGRTGYVVCHESSPFRFNDWKCDPTLLLVDQWCSLLHHLLCDTCTLSVVVIVVIIYMPQYTVRPSGAFGPAWWCVLVIFKRCNSKITCL